MTSLKSFREALNSYFDKMGAEYKQSAEVRFPFQSATGTDFHLLKFSRQEQRKLREVRHPGQLHGHSVVDVFVRQIKALSATKTKAVSAHPNSSYFAMCHT